MTTPTDPRQITRPTVCESCGASIFFVHNDQGELQTLDTRPQPDGVLRLELRSHQDGRGLRVVAVYDQPSLLEELAGADHERYVDHFDTCPDAEAWRGRTRRDRRRSHR